jgi:hypothetical protein
MTERQTEHTERQENLEQPKIIAQGGYVAPSSDHYWIVDDQNAYRDYMNGPGQHTPPWMHGSGHCQVTTGVTRMNAKRYHEQYGIPDDETKPDPTSSSC